MAGYALAAYQGTTNPSHLYLIQSENEADGEELNKMLTQMAPGSSDPNTRLTVIENRPVTIRGQEATLILAAKREALFVHARAAAGQPPAPAPAPPSDAPQPEAVKPKPSRAKKKEEEK